ncbi:MAG: LuxR C-terminal-related transcriptional regulator, partial [Dehalococcoidia bacterium]|nr:LuxR C-terminal-related transcriptional regulator [Dehalococcoidia bacterium]
QVLNYFVPNSGGGRRRERSGVLSKRELDIVKLIARGLSNREIATGLGLSIRTVQGHIGQVFKKLGASSRTEALVRVLKEGWVTLDDVTREISTTG